MKKLLAIAMIILSAGAKAQVVLEHSYTTNWPMEVVNIEGDGYKYLGVDTTTKNIKIYNTDHSLWKTINTNIPQGAVIYATSSYASKYLFNADNKIEVMVLYATFGPTVFKAELYNEDGVALNTFNDAALYNLANVNGNWKLLIRLSGSPDHTDIYTLPGQWTGVSIVGKPALINNIYPNPTQNVAAITYTLPQGNTTARLNVYNETGKLVRSYIISNQFSELLVNTSDLSAGVYFYDIVTTNGRQIGQKFIVQ